MVDKRCNFMFLFIVALLLGSCGNDQANEIADSIENMQIEAEKDRGTFHQSNIKEQNKEVVQNEPETEEYAEHVGHYLHQFYIELEKSRDFFYKQSPTKEEAKKVLAQLDKIKKINDKLFQLQLPDEFQGFHHVHMSALIEFDSLTTTLRAMNKPTRDEMTKARVFYENTVISLKQMEREYKSVLMNLGMY